MLKKQVFSSLVEHWDGLVSLSASSTCLGILELQGCKVLHACLVDYSKWLFLGHC